MAPQNSHFHRHTLSSSSSSSSLLDALFCEEHWEEEVEDSRTPKFTPIVMMEKDLIWEDEELRTLFLKEQQIDLDVVKAFSMERREAVEWFLTASSNYGFSTLTAILAVNYFDRFLQKSTHLYHPNKPWMTQLTAVTCLSLAAKVEEIDVPLLLDLQMVGTKYLFETKTIEKMELLILSTLDWRMHPVTPISFLDHIVRRLGLNSQILPEFHRRCEQQLLSIFADSKSVGYLPSVLATATMIHVIDHIESSKTIDYQTQLLSILNISKEKVKDCYEMIQLSIRSAQTIGIKRQRQPIHETPASPKGVIDAYYFSSDTSNESWAVTGGGLSTSPSVSSSPAQRAMKRKRVDEYMPSGPFGDGFGVAMMSVIIGSLMRHVVIKELQVLFLVLPLLLCKRY